MKTPLLSTLFLLAGLPAWGACQNFVAKSEVPALLAQVSGAGNKACGGADPCVCYDGIDDWTVAQFDGVVLSNDPVKKAARDAALSAAATDVATRSTKRAARLISLRQCVQDLKGAATAAQVKQCILLLLQDVKESDLQTSDL